MKNDKDSDAKAWELIGSGDYAGSRIRSSYIRNPVVRYVHKMLSQTLFAREDADKIKMDEMALLINGIKPLFEDELESNGIVGYEGWNLGILLAKQILYLKENWVLKQEEGAKVYIGGFLTPILLACKVPLGNPCDKPSNYLDMNNLNKTHFLGGKDGERIIYNFITSRGEGAWVYLPNRDITRLDSLENLMFLQGESVTIEEAIEPEPIGRRKRGKRTQSESRPQELPLGSPRYYHSRYKGRVQSNALKHALEGVEKNQRMGRWHSRVLHNVTKGFKKRIKELEGSLSDLKSVVETFVLRKRSPPRYEDGSTSYGLAMEEARRHSISHLPSHSGANVDEPPRASSYENQAPRRRRYRHIPTPSPPSSDNELLHLSDSYSEG